MTLLLSLLLFALLAQRIQSSQKQDAEQRLARQTEVIQSVINGLCSNPFGCIFKRNDFRDYMVGSSKLLDARLLIVDQRSLVWIDTQQGGNLEDTTLNDYQLVPRDNNPHNGTISLNGHSYLYYALPGPPITDNRTGAVEGATVAGATKVSQNFQVQSSKYQTDLLLTVPEGSIEASWNDLVLGLILSGVIALCVSVGAAVFVARSVAKPLIRMTRASEAIAEGDYSQQIPVTKNSEGDEMGRLAMALNWMARKVAHSQQSMRDFVANVSHELKTPLTSIQGFSQAIMDGTADNPDAVQHSATVINREAVRMRRLVDELLDLSRVESGQVEWNWREVPLNQLLTHIVNRLEPLAAQKNITILTNFNNLSGAEAQLNGRTTFEPQIWGDGDRLEQIFTNILDNAIKYSPAAQQVELKVTLAATPPDKTSGHLPPGTAPKVTVEVSNRGPYIRPEERPRIFERFYKLDKSRARRKGESTGLGLAIAKELVEIHHGTINVTSVPLDSGSKYPLPLPTPVFQEGLTTFTVCLPLSSLKNASLPQAQG